MTKKLLTAIVLFTTIGFLAYYKKMETLTGPEIWEKMFIPEIYKKFQKEVPSINKLEAFFKKNDAKLILDHGATRTVDPKIHDFITRLAGSFGLKPHANYEFPEKKLVAVDLQFEDLHGFKWFSTLIEYKKFSPEAIKAIEEDMAITNNKLSDKSMAHLQKLEKEGKLSKPEAEEFVHDVVYGFLSRQGPPLKQSTYDLIAKESSETINALLVGPDFNHIAYALHELNIKDWYGVEVIDVLNERMKLDGFEMLPEIQGPAGGVLRQTSTKADKLEFKLTQNDGSEATTRHPAKFIELIQRGPEKDEQGKILFDNGKLRRFQGFLSKNTVKLYDATSTKTS